MAPPRHQRQQIGIQTKDIIVNGTYTDESATRETHFVAKPIQAAILSTVVYSPEDLSAPRPVVDPKSDAPLMSTAPVIEVTQEKTQAAAYRLRSENVAVLNFASAKNPCGGFKTGAQAQEEDLARSSALSACLDRGAVVDAYYKPNRACGSVLYLDSVVYSGGVPFWRSGSPALCDLFLASVVSAPAPNYGAQKPGKKVGDDEFEEIYCRRARFVLEVLKREGHRTIVLGAWGCGVFQVPPTMAAACFKRLLEGEFAGTFDTVVFAVYDGETKRKCFEAFRKTFA